MWSRSLKNLMETMLSRPPILIVLGATGTGKSKATVELAKRFNGEIINGDAMQMYAGLPIITNKVTNEEQEGIPHHLLGRIQLEEETWRVGVFQREATSIIRQIHARGNVPVIVGGTHYYIQSLLFGDSIVGENQTDEGELLGSLSTTNTSREFPILDGPPDLILKKLREIDPVMARRWHPNDTRKISRSLEIFLKTGEKASDIYARQQESSNMKNNDSLKLESAGENFSPETTLLFWIYTEPEVLKKRLDARVHQMMRAGLLDEVKTMDQYLQTQQTAGLKVDGSQGIWASIGWKEFKPYLEALKSGGNLEDALSLSIQKTQAATRQYAKRQIRWIEMKLRTALAKSQGWNDRLYLLDGNDVSNFKENVADLAIKITADFLDGKKLLLPQEISSTAKTVLSCKKKKPDVWFRKTCEICLITSMNEIEWEAHLKSRKHRGLAKKRLKNVVKEKLEGTRPHESSASETPLSISGNFSSDI
ncbi:hypothetical protein Golomagni_02534 [Golovinomyces magnicellulatus]|nr:hypothetical protein Golomagni_02534 [Golovinomyces magnicellulatus]